MSLYPKLDPKRQGRDEQPRRREREAPVIEREEQFERPERPVRQRNPETDRAVDEWLNHLDKGFEIARNKGRTARERQSSPGPRGTGQRQTKASPKGMDDWIKKREETWRRI
jgi:hypothetical protein